MPNLRALDSLRVVLVAPRNPLNIGAVARAMSNFGFSQLRVVNPYEVAFRDARSAVGASPVLVNAKEFATVAEAVADCAIVVGTTAIRHRQLQQPLKIDSLYYDGKLYINYPKRPYYNEGNVWHVPLPNAAKNSIHTITIVYHGNPRIAVNPPWNGGWTFTKDAMGRPWMTVTCQGLGASVWYPCKDHQSDKPDSALDAKCRGRGSRKRSFIEPATSGFLKPDYESGALAPLSGSDQAEPPRQKARAESIAKKH